LRPDLFDEYDAKSKNAAKTVQRIAETYADKMITEVREEPNYTQCFCCNNCAKAKLQQKKDETPTTGNVDRPTSQYIEALRNIFKVRKYFCIVCYCTQ